MRTSRSTLCCASARPNLLHAEPMSLDAGKLIYHVTNEIESCSEPPTRLWRYTRLPPRCVASVGHMSGTWPPIAVPQRACCIHSAVHALSRTGACSRAEPCIGGSWLPPPSQSPGCTSGCRHRPHCCSNTSRSIKRARPSGESLPCAPEPWRRPKPSFFRSCGWLAAPSAAWRMRARALLALLALCAALAAWPAAARAPSPLAAALAGRVYTLDAAAAALELPLTCAGRDQVGLALQQPAPPGAAGHCRARLEVLEQGPSAALVARWLGQQVRGTTRWAWAPQPCCIRCGGPGARPGRCPARLQQRLAAAVPPSPLTPVAVWSALPTAYWRPRLMDGHVQPCQTAWAF